jgi:hypothetical protein
MLIAGRTGKAVVTLLAAHPLVGVDDSFHSGLSIIFPAKVIKKIQIGVCPCSISQLFLTFVSK